MTDTYFATNNPFVQWLIQQGIGAVLAFGMFLIYRKDAKDGIKSANETAYAYMQFGQQQAASLADVANGLARQAAVLERIEQRLDLELATRMRPPG